MAAATTLLRNLVDNIAKEQEYENHDATIEPITSGGANYTSALFLATVSSPNKADLNLFAKVAIVSEKMRELMNAKTLYSCEVFFYTELVKIYQEIEDKCGLEEEKLVFPKFYGCRTELYEEVVVLENLVANGCYIYDRFKSIDWDHASSAVDVLAKFHALSFALQKLEPEKFEGIAQKHILQKFEKNDDLKIFERYMRNALNTVKEEYREGIIKFLSDGGEDKFIQFNQPISAKVLMHGDYRPSNLLFRKTDNKIQSIPVDFQTIRTGSCAADLVYFIFIGSDAKFRRQHYTELVDRYYDRLATAMAAFGVDIDVYPRHIFDEELKKMLPYALYIGIAILPLVTVDEESAPRIDGNATMESFISFDTNDLYANRFREIVEDSVKWGII